MDSTGVTAMFRALGDPTRLRIFEFLCSRCGPVALDESGDVRPVKGATVGEVCCQVTGHEKFSSTVSFHLRELRLAGLVCSEKAGKFMVCSVNRAAVAAMTRYLNGLPTAGSQECR